MKGGTLSELGSPMKAPCQELSIVLLMFYPRRLRYMGNTHVVSQHISLAGKLVTMKTTHLLILLNIDPQVCHFLGVLSSIYPVPIQDGANLTKE